MIRERYIVIIPVSLTREALPKGKAQYSWPPGTNRHESVHFCTEDIIYYLYLTTYPNEEVNCTEPSPLVSVPCFD